MWLSVLVIGSHNLKSHFLKRICKQFWSRTRLAYARALSRRVTSPQTYKTHRWLVNCNSLYCRPAIVCGPTPLSIEFCWLSFRCCSRARCWWMAKLDSTDSMIVCSGVMSWLENSFSEEKTWQSELVRLKISYCQLIFLFTIKRYDLRNFWKFFDLVRCKILKRKVSSFHIILKKKV